MAGELERSHLVYVVSDATGGTARRVVDAALMQFKGAIVSVEQVPRVRKVKEVKKLVKLRQARQSRMARGLSMGYARPEHVQQELDWAELLLRRERWPMVDVTNKSIEECAAEIIALQGRRIDRTAPRVKTGVGRTARRPAGRPRA